MDEALVVRNVVNEPFFKAWEAKRNGNAGEPQKEPQAPQAQTDVNAVLNTVLDKAGSGVPGSALEP